MIKYNSNTINNWYYGDDNIVKVYRNGAVCYYKIISSGGTTAQTPCYAVVNDISQYEDTEFEDVFNNGDGKWYKLNNFNQYEEYGLYGSGRTITYYEGKLTIDDGYEYIYSGGSWNNVGEVSGSTATLPNVDFMLNYNARDYVASTYTIPKTSGQIKDVDAVCNYGYNIVDHHEDGYITVTGDTRMILSGSTYLGRNNNQTGCTMTIVSKAKTTSGYSILTNRGNNQTSQMNWMWRYLSNGIFLHGGSSYNSVKYYTNTTVNPIIASIRTSYNNRVVQQLNDWTNNGSYNGSFAFSTEYNGNSSLFCDYASNNSEFWHGDFYWVYMSKDVLTDEQIQQVIAYNEGGGGTEIYPLYYDEKLDPPNNVSFTSMTEAEDYECPWVGMQATIDGVIYVFSGDSTSGYEWVEKPSKLPQGYTEVEYIENISGETTPTSSTKYNLAYIDTNFVANQNTRIVAELQVTTPSTNPRYFGSGKWNGLGFIVSQEGTLGASRTRIYYKYGQSTSWMQTSYVPDMQRHVYDLNNNGEFVIDNVAVATLPTTSFTCDTSICIFTASRSNDTYVDLGETLFGRMFSFKIYSNGILVRDFVPCTRDSDGKAGVYDIVNDGFYSSANSNNIIAGPTV